MDSNTADRRLSAVADLARREGPRLAAQARAQGLSAEDAFDCVQDALCTFLGMSRQGRLPTDEDEWAPLLAGVVRNTARNRRRRHFLAQPHESVQEERPLTAEDPPTDERLAQQQMHGRLHACVSGLCAIQRAVVTLRMLEEQSGDEVARALGISPGRVAVLLFRAKAVLRACMDQAEGLSARP